jgi:putative membrane protein
MFKSRTLRSHNHDGAVLKGIAAGLAGGLVASYVMNQFQAVTQKIADSAGKGRRKRKRKQDDGEDATVRTAEAITEAFGHRLTKQEKQVAGPAVHYAFGATMGGVYGALAELSPKLAAGGGLPFGTALWLAADEVAVPALGLGKKPTETPAPVHAYALASHAVYGLTAEIVRRAVRRALH